MPSSGDFSLGFDAIQGLLYFLGFDATLQPLWAWGSLFSIWDAEGNRQSHFSAQPPQLKPETNVQRHVYIPVYPPSIRGFVLSQTSAIATKPILPFSVHLHRIKGN